MALVFSYLRFSCKAQGKGDSKRRQIEDAGEWITRHEHTLASLTLHDLGYSAFRGLNQHKGALDVFVKAVEAKDSPIPKGSILLVEHLDRLSRQAVDDAFDLFKKILKLGVNIAVLRPYERVYTAADLKTITGLMEPLFHFHLAYEESAKKSFRVGAVWKERRKNAATKKITHRCPAWMRWDDPSQDFVLIPEAVAALRYLFQSTIDGKGQRVVLGELEKKFPAIGRSGKWNGSYLAKVLNDKAVFGEFQPHTFVYDDKGNPKRIPEGDEIPNYFPAAISEGMFYQAQEAKAGRLKTKGPNAKFVNLFAGRIFCANDKYACHVQTTKSRRKRGDQYIQRRFVSYGHHRKVAGTCALSFDYYALEKALLQVLTEIIPEQLQPSNGHNEPYPLAAKETELAGIDGRLKELEEQLATTQKPLGTIIRAVERLEGEKAAIEAEIEILKRQKAVQDADPLVEAQSIIAMLEKNEGEQLRNLRLKLRAKIGDVVETIYLQFWNHLPEHSNWRKVGAGVQINFKGGGTKLILCLPDNMITFGTPHLYDQPSLLPDLRTAKPDELEDPSMFCMAILQSIFVNGDLSGVHPKVLELHELMAKTIEEKKQKPRGKRKPR